MNYHSPLRPRSINGRPQLLFFPIVIPPVTVTPAEGGDYLLTIWWPSDALRSFSSHSIVCADLTTFFESLAADPEETLVRYFGVSRKSEVGAWVGAAAEAVKAAQSGASKKEAPPAEMDF